ncbi:hypothetical protein FHG87_019674 [Trinorchestia longiramus]|nr:hypothetical protein FHG87_019674 [Trinorchestia longiramus]
MSSSSDSPLIALPALSSDVQKELFQLNCSLTNLWEHGLRVQKRFTDAEQVLKPGPGPIKMLVAVDSMKMVNLVPMDAPHPLYHAAPDCSALRHSFLLNAMLETGVDLEDPSLLQGVTLTNANGKEIVFKKDDKGEVTANGIRVTSHHRLSDGTALLITEELLFGLEEAVKEAFQDLMARTSAHGGCGTGLCSMLGKASQGLQDKKTE